MTIGKRIVQLRRHLGMTQAELSGKIGFTSSHISKIERGLIDPSEEFLFSVSNATSVRFEWLINGVGPMFDTKVPPVDFASIGERIRKARKEAGYTQKELAGKIKCTYEMVSKAELSKLKPSERWLRKVAAECHVALQWLLTGQEDGHRSVDQDIDQIGAFLRKIESLSWKRSEPRMMESGLDLNIWYGSRRNKAWTRFSQLGCPATDSLIWLPFPIH